LSGKTNQEKYRDRGAERFEKRDEEDCWIWKNYPKALATNFKKLLGRK